jgi:hypothetical protein
MAENIPEEAVERVGEWLQKWYQGGCNWVDLSEGQRERYRKDAREILALAIPIIRQKEDAEWVKALMQIGIMAELNPQKAAEGIKAVMDDIEKRAREDGRRRTTLELLESPKLIWEFINKEQHTKRYKELLITVKAMLHDFIVLEIKALKEERGK